MSTGYSRSPKLLKGAIIQFSAPMIVPIPNVIIFQYNPESLSRTLEPYQLPDSKAAGPDKAVPDAAGTSQPKPPVEKFTLALQLDASDALEEPGIRIRRRSSPASPTASRRSRCCFMPADSKGLGLSLSISIGGSLGGGSAGVASQAAPVPQAEQVPPTVLFIWGPGRIVPVRINTFAVEEQLNNPMLYPLRAKVSLGMQVLTDADFGSDPDTIEKLAIACYKFTMTQNRVLALANVANGVESILGMLPF